MPVPTAMQQPCRITCSTADRPPCCSASEASELFWQLLPSGLEVLWKRLSRSSAYCTVVLLTVTAMVLSTILGMEDGNLVRKHQLPLSFRMTVAHLTAHSAKSIHRLPSWIRPDLRIAQHQVQVRKWLGKGVGRADSTDCSAAPLK